MTAASVVISERAARRIGEILKTEGDGAMLRISVEGGGCSGFQYKFDVERAQAEDDLVIARDSAVVLVDPASVPFDPNAATNAAAPASGVGSPMRANTPVTTLQIANCEPTEISICPVRITSTMPSATISTGMLASTRSR